MFFIGPQDPCRYESDQQNKWNPWKNHKIVLTSEIGIIRKNDWKAIQFTINIQLNLLGHKYQDPITAVIFKSFQNMLTHGWTISAGNHIKHKKHPESAYLRHAWFDKRETVESRLLTHTKKNPGSRWYCITAPQSVLLILKNNENLLIHFSVMLQTIIHSFLKIRKRILHPNQRVKQEAPQISPIIPCIISDLSWKFHDNLFQQFSLMLLGNKQTITIT